MLELIGTTKQQIRVSRKSRNIQALRRFGESLAHYAIYRPYDNKGRRFHSAASESHLIEHKNVPYWLNRSK